LSNHDPGISESFVLTENKMNYGKVIEFKIEMTLKLNINDVKLSFGDKFLVQADLQVYFPGIIGLWDPYHFCFLFGKIERVSSLPHLVHILIGIFSRML
jgi:hypothetical protein